MKISLIHPSRGRAEKSVRNAEEWVLKAGKGIDVEVIVSLDNSDKSLPEYNELHLKSWIRRNSILIYNDNDCVVSATNHAAKKAYGDILVYLSDDFKCHDNWGQNLVKEFSDVHYSINPKDVPSYHKGMLLKVDDCLQKFSARVLTIPIMNRALYDKLGYFFHPRYKSMWVDCDLYETCDRLGAIKNAEHLKFPHEHHCIGKAPNDETYRRSEANWSQGKTLFDKRKRQGFLI